MAASPGAADWALWAVAATLAAVSIFITRDAWLDLIRIARADEEASHLRLVPIAALWLLWTRKERVAAAGGGGFVWAIGLAIAGAALYLGGERAVIEAFWHAGAIVLFVAAFAAAFGGEKLKAAWPAAVCLLFAVPVPGSIRAQIAIPLQQWSASSAAFCLELLGEPVILKGSVLNLGGVDVAVAEACNGMRMFFALALVAYLYAFLHPLTKGTRIALLAISPIIALGCNIVRLVPTAWMYGHASESAADGFHDFGGWAMLFVAYFALAGIVALARWLGVTVDAKPFEADPSVSPAPRATRDVMVAAGAVVAVLALTYTDRWIVRQPLPETLAFHAHVRDEFATAPDMVSDAVGRVWVGEQIEVPPAAVTMLEPNAMISRRFRRLGGDEASASASDPASLQLLAIHCNDARDLLGHYPPNCYPAMGWKMLEATPVDWPNVSVPDAPAAYVGMRYTFEATQERVVHRIRVYNMMLLPDGTVGRDMESISGATRRLRLRELGAGQLQLLFRVPPQEAADGRIASDEALEAERTLVGEFLTAHAEQLDAMLSFKPAETGRLVTPEAAQK